MHPHFLVGEPIFLQDRFIDVLLEALNDLVQLVLRHIRSTNNLIKRIETAQEFMRIGADIEDPHLASAHFSLAVLSAFNLLVALLFQNDEVLRNVRGMLHLVHVHIFILVNFIKEYVFYVDAKSVLLEELAVSFQNLNGFLKFLD